MEIYYKTYWIVWYVRYKSINHTYKCDLEKFLGTKSLLIDKYETLPINKIIVIYMVEAYEYKQQVIDNLNSIDNDTDNF